MRATSIAALLLSFWACQIWAVDVKNGLDPTETVGRINANYNAITQCQEPDTGAPRGHYYCSGVTLRMVNDGNFNPWDYSPYAVQTGATSYSWIRRDLSINQLVHPAGFIIRTPTDSAALRLPVKETGWTCIYSFDGFTGPDRKWYGCGPFKDLTFAPPAQPSTNNKNAQWAYGTCASQKVETAEQWQNKFPGGPGHPIQTDQCSWNAEVPAQWDAMIKAHEARATAPPNEPYAVKSQFNEFMLKNASNTGDGSDNMQYIDAFIYNANSVNNIPTRGDTAAPKPEDGLTSARHFQQKLYSRGFAVPILRLDFTKPPAQRFSYEIADQVISLNVSNAIPGRYIALSNWIKRLDPGTAQPEWTLTVDLTAEGQKLSASGSQALYDELYAARGKDEIWLREERSPGSMLKQVECLKKNYPAKTQLNLEPFRPIVSDSDAKIAGCNPVAKK